MNETVILSCDMYYVAKLDVQVTSVSVTLEENVTLKKVYVQILVILAEGPPVTISVYTLRSKTRHYKRMSH